MSMYGFSLMDVHRVAIRIGVPCVFIAFPRLSARTEQDVAQIHSPERSITYRDQPLRFYNERITFLK